LATTLGSFISGFISFYFGYYVTFISAAACLAAAAALTSSLGAGAVRSEGIYEKPRQRSESRFKKAGAVADSRSGTIGGVFP
jgi:hypothetical protein